MEINEDDIEFDRAVSQKRHKQLIESLKSVTTELEKKPADDGLKDKLDKHMAAITKLAESFRDIPKPDAPIVNVSTDNKEIVESFRHIAEQITVELIALKECYSAKQSDCYVEFSRDRNGFITSPIIIKAK